MSRFKVYRTTMEARTCIEVHRTDRRVFFLRLQEPIDVENTSIDSFKNMWTEIDTEPQHAARVYSASHFSRTERATRYLSAIISGETEDQELTEMAKKAEPTKAAAAAKPAAAAKSAHAKAYANVPTTPAAEKAGKGKATPAATKEKAPKAEKAPKEGGRAGRFGPKDKITKLEVGNPKREGSAGHARFELYKTGMTVEKFIELGGTMGDVRYDVDHGFISVEAAAV